MHSGSALLVATIMAPWLTSGYGAAARAASPGGGTTSMSLRRNCLLWQCTKAVLQALPLVEAGAEKVREGKERAQQRSAFREHDFDGGGDGGTPCRQARDVRAWLGRCCVEGEFQQQPQQQLDGVALLATAAAARRCPRRLQFARRAAARASTNTTDIVLSS